MTDIPLAHVAPMAEVPDLRAELDWGAVTAGVRDPRDTRTHIDRICPYLPGESYAGAGGNAVVHDALTEVAPETPAEG